MQPDYFDAYSDLGAFLNRRGRYDEAEHYFRAAIEIKPEHIHGLWRPRPRVRGASERYYRCSSRSYMHL